MMFRNAETGHETDEFVDMGCREYECSVDKCPVKKLYKSRGYHDGCGAFAAASESNLIEAAHLLGYEPIEEEEDNMEEKHTEPTIKDSGERTEYSTGAVRDCKEGKGRCDLMPLDVIGHLMHENVLAFIGESKARGVESLYSALREFAWGRESECDEALPELMLDLAKHFEDGAKKYGEYNWQKGIPVHSYIDSAVRHYLKYMAAWDDEPHGRAFVWNIVCCIWTMTHHPELDDWTEKEAGEDG